METFRAFAFDCVVGVESVGKGYDFYFKSFRKQGFDVSYRGFSSRRVAVVTDVHHIHATLDFACLHGSECGTHSRNGVIYTRARKRDYVHVPFDENEVFEPPVLPFLFFTKFIP